MEWDSEYTDEFGVSWDGLSEGELESVRAAIKLWVVLAQAFPFLIPAVSRGRSTATCVNCAFSTPGDLIECSTPLILAGILLIGGDKSGKDRWYDEYVPIADRLYKEHLEILRREGLINGS
jgi:hypothetical protein